MAERDHWADRLDETREERAQLAAELRRLIDATVAVDAPVEVLRRARTAVADVVAALEPMVPEPRPPRYPRAAASQIADFFPFDPIIGRLSPLAPPLRILWEEPRAIGTVTFTTPYEGPPGCVHGGVIAATFDQVFNVANLMRGVAGPTRRLEIRYLRPTPLGVELRFEGRVESVEGRDVRTVGRVVCGGETTVEAHGSFVQLSYEKVMRLLETPEPRTGPAADATGSAGAGGPVAGEGAAAPEPTATAATPKARSSSGSAAARRRRFRSSGDGT